ncbi:MAG TPA: GNAT family N-acetyltransferase [Pirellulaceae bacterium]|nr:GNAT family N-acetyltransferase [Pirellulaceae bacterium]
MPSTSAPLDCQVQVKSVDQLTSEEWETWERIRAAVAWLDAPFFSPRFVRAAAQVNPAVRVAVIWNAQNLLGFWPFEFAGRTGRPVASLITEMTGLIMNPHDPLRLDRLLPALGLDRWHFDCVPSTQLPMTPFVIRNMDSVYISLREGYGSYRQHLLSKHPRQLPDNARKLRKLEHEHGAATWNWNVPEPRLLDELFRWKRNQYQQAGVIDVLGVPALRDLIRRLLEEQTESFGGVLSLLSVRGKPVAIHYGLRDQKVMTSWFHAYDPEYAIYSPGRISMFKLVEDAANQGLERIDFGQGNERYKASMCNGSMTVGEGVVCRRKVDQLMMSAWIRAREFASSSSAMRVPLRWFRYLRGKWKGAAS